MRKTFTNQFKNQINIKKIKKKIIYFETFLIFLVKFYKIKKFKRKQIKYIHSSFQFPFLNNNNFRYKKKNF